MHADNSRRYVSDVVRPSHTSDNHDLRARPLKRAFIVIGAVVGLMAAWSVVSKKIPSSVEYHGQQIKLTRYYLDYDEYKNDPDNIDPSETLRVQHLVMESPIARSFSDRKAMSRAAFDIKFPGYGAGGMGDGREGEGSISGLSVEIPRADKSRYLVFQCRAGKYVLVDDFVESDVPLLMHVQSDGKNLIYSSYDEQRKLVRSPRYK